MSQLPLLLQSEHRASSLEGAHEAMHAGCKPCIQAGSRACRLDRLIVCMGDLLTLLLLHLLSPPLLLPAVLTKKWVLDLPVYQDARRRLKNTSKALEDLQTKPKKGKDMSKDMKALEDAATMDQQVLTGLKLRSSLVMAFSQIFVLYIISSLFDGVVIAKLPFTPFSYFQGLFHRGVPGEDYTEAGYLFVWILSSMFIRPLVSKWLGTEEAPVGGNISAFGPAGKLFSGQ